MSSDLYPRGRIETRLRTFAIESACRIIWRRHRSDLLAPKPRRSRFSDGSFAVIYAASKFETALIETIIRDRFVRTNERTISNTEHIHERLVATLRTAPSVELNLLDLRDAGIVELGAPTDALRARNQQAGQALGREIYHGHGDVDGIVYPSRFDGNNNFAIFDRAVDRLDVVEIGELSAHPGLADALTRLQIGISHSLFSR